ncbi:MAG: hypothetical protein ACJAYC_002267 [Halieaceae bacterium]|jgi:hypothetical protein
MSKAQSGNSVHTAAPLAELEHKSVFEYAEEYQLLSDSELPTSQGFSARLNMLWDLAAVAPSQFEGRISGVMAVNTRWKDSDVRAWLQRDVVPPPLELHNMVKFLVAQLPQGHDPKRWKAFLIYGVPTVASPVDHLIYREDQSRRNIASMIFAQITDKYELPPSSYEAEEVFQRCLTLMHKFNIYEARDFQPGHMEPFKNFMFPNG